MTVGVADIRCHVRMIARTRRICQTRTVRRSLGGIILVVAGAFFALGVGAFWLHHVAFSPDTSTDRVHDVLRDDAIRNQISTVIAGADAGELGMSPIDLREFVDQIAGLRPGAALMAGFVADAHSRVIGDRDDLVSISAAEQVEIVRNERVANMPSIILPVQESGTLAAVNTVTEWTSLISLGLAVVLGLLGLLLRPEPGEVPFAVGSALVATAVSLVVLGYLVPLGVLPAAADEPWANLFPRLANQSRNLTLLIAAASGVAGGLVLYTGTTGRSRRSSASSIPVGGYRAQHRWSR